MQIKFTKKRHGTQTIRFVDIIIDINKAATLIFVPQDVEYKLLLKTQSMPMDIIVTIMLFVNSHIRDNGQLG